MPIHEYRCESCNSLSEHLVGVTAQQEKLACPQCGSEKMNRALSLFAVNVRSAPGFDCGSCEQAAPSAGGCGCSGGCCH